MTDRNEHGHIIGPVVDINLPLVVLDITGGVVQGEYTYPGTGVPFVFTLDFDREEADLEELQAFRWATVEAACVAIEGRSDHPDDLVQTAEWRRQADEMVDNAEETWADSFIVDDINDETGERGE